MSAALELAFQEVEGGQLPIHLSRPTAKPQAAVIVCHHAVGIYQNSFQRRFCDALAKCGFLVALPDFYHRAWASTDVAESKGDGLAQKDIPVVSLIRSLQDAHIQHDLHGALKLLENEGVARVGITGFCLGGRTSWLAGCAFSDKIQACCMYHGGNIKVPLDGGLSGFAKMAVGQMIGSWASNWVPGSRKPAPWELREGLRCPVMGHFGALDSNPSPADAKMIKEALDQQGVVAEFYEYEGAQHGFSCADSTAYQQVGADLAWNRTIEFFCRTLGQPMPDQLPDPPQQEDAMQVGGACTSGCEEIRRSRQ